MTEIDRPISELEKIIAKQRIPIVPFYALSCHIGGLIARFNPRYREELLREAVNMAHDTGEVDALGIRILPLYLKQEERTLFFRRMDGALRFFRAKKEGDLDLL